MGAEAGAVMGGWTAGRGVDEVDVVGSDAPWALPLPLSSLVDFHLGLAGGDVGEVGVACFING